MAKTYSVLFIGNSYTYYNQMPTALFQVIAEHAGLSLDVESITKGGYTLQQHGDLTSVTGEQVAAALDGSKHYDFVILQEQSIRPAGETAELFYDAVRTFCGKIRAIGAQPVLYATWGRKTGAKPLEVRGWTNAVMTQRLAASYQAMGDELNVPVAHVGLAFRDVYTGDSGIELYNVDHTHPSYAGSYLAAMTLLAKIFGIDPTTVAYDGILSKEGAATLREAARKAVFETPAIAKV